MLLFLYLREAKKTMIKSTELRIGNYISCESNPIAKVVSIDDSIRVNKQCENEIDYQINQGWLKEIKPIPITEEWLARFGAKKDEKSGFSNTYRIEINEHIGIFINIFEKGYRGWIGYYELKPYDIPGIPIYYDVLYVHQLQNLYFALTNKELECIFISRPA